MHFVSVMLLSAHHICCGVQAVRGGTGFVCLSFDALRWLRSLVRLAGRRSLHVLFWCQRVDFVFACWRSLGAAQTLTLWYDYKPAAHDDPLLLVEPVVHGMIGGGT